MNARALGSRTLIVAGGLAMVAGAIDPLEGSLLILPGSGFVALGAWLGRQSRAWLTYWLWVFGLVASGVGAMFVLSAFGGIGGRSGHSMWWGLLLIPYPIGWLMGIVGLIVRLFKKIFQLRPPKSTSNPS